MTQNVQRKQFFLVYHDHPQIAWTLVIDWTSGFHLIGWPTIPGLHGSVASCHSFIGWKEQLSFLIITSWVWTFTYKYIFIFNIPHFGIYKLPLHIETGRFRDKTTNEMVYLICNSGEAENELHFLCVCAIYYNYRENNYSIVNNDNILNVSNDEKFVFLLR